MPEKGLFHTFRRKTFGRSPEEDDTHERNFKELKTAVGKIAQRAIDDLAARYENEDVKNKVDAAHDQNGLHEFTSELNGLQVAIIEAKGRFLEERKNDVMNDLEEADKETAAWEKELKELIDGSDFRRLAEKYEVWGHEPVTVNHIAKATHGKVIHIRPAA